MKRLCPIAASALSNPTAVAWVWDRKPVSYRQADAWVAAWAAHFVARGVGEGDSVVACTPNRLEVLPAFFACGRLGARWVPLNARLTAPEVAALTSAVSPTLCMLTPAEWPVLAPSKSPSAWVEGDADAAGLFTSGTTGVPKCVSLSHDNFFASAQASGAHLGTRSAQVWWGSLPLFHVGGLAMAHRCAVYGATLALEPGFDAARTAQAFERGEVTHASLVATTLARTLEALGARRAHGVEAVLVGGGPVSTNLLQRAQAAGLPVVQTYGLTEACSQVCTERLGFADGQTCGPPLPGVEVRVIDDAGIPVGVNCEGFIEVRGPTVPRALGPWLATRDLGRLDAQGRLTVLGRRVDLIISGGENIYPVEVERALDAHAGVVECAVVPRVDDDWGQVPVAFVVRAQPDLDAAALREHLKARLAAYKCPREIHFVESLPRNAMGKLDRAALTRSKA